MKTTNRQASYRVNIDTVTDYRQAVLAAIARIAATKPPMVSAGNLSGVCGERRAEVELSSTLFELLFLEKSFRVTIPRRLPRGTVAP
jgi:hypothetical protein